MAAPACRRSAAAPFALLAAKSPIDLRSQRDRALSVPDARDIRRQVAGRVEERDLAEMIRYLDEATCQEEMSLTRGTMSAVGAVDRTTSVTERAGTRMLDSAGLECVKRWRTASAIDENGQAYSSRCL